MVTLTDQLPACGYEHFHAEGFLEIGVSAAVESLNLFLFSGNGSQQDNRDVRCFFVGTYSSGQFEARHYGHDDITYNEVGSWGVFSVKLV